MRSTRYCTKRQSRQELRKIWFLGLHNDVYIKYVHNIQKLQNCENNIEIPLVLRYSINYKRIEVGRNNIPSINCDIVFPAPQDIVPAVGCVV